MKRKTRKNESSAKYKEINYAKRKRSKCICYRMLMDKIEKQNIIRTGNALRNYKMEETNA